MDSTAWIALAIFMVVYVFIVSEKIHRTVIALTGAMLMIVCGILTQEMAIHHIDFNTIGLLAGMMVVVNITGETGLFNYLAVWAAKKVKAETSSENNTLMNGYLHKLPYTRNGTVANTVVYDFVTSPLNLEGEKTDNSIVTSSLNYPLIIICSASFCAFVWVTSYLISKYKIKEIKQNIATTN